MLYVCTLERMNITDNVIRSPLSFAAREGNVNAIKGLLVKGHNPCLNDNRGWTPLHEAAAGGHINCVRIFLEHEGCNINARTYEGMTPLFLACSLQNDSDLIEVLLEHGADCKIGTMEGVTPLHVACSKYKIEVVKKLVCNGANLNVRDFNGFTSLLEAIDQISTVTLNDHSNSLDVVKFLLDRGADVSIGDEHGRRPFFVAVSKNWEECIKLMLERGANVNDCTTDGSTALIIAAQGGNLQMVKFMLDVGADPEKRCDDGTMPLHHALHNGHISVAEELVRRIKIKKLVGQKGIESFLILAIDSTSFESYKFVVKHKIYSEADRINVSSDRHTVLNNFYFRHYRRQSPISFLLFHHLELSHCLPILKDLLNSGVYGANAKYWNDIPPLVALIEGGSRASNSDRMKYIKTECFYTLLENGANIDYCSSYDCLEIPDCILAIMLSSTCGSNNILLMEFLSRCFSRTWDELLEWLVKDQTVSVPVINVLMQLSTKPQQDLQKILSSIKKCPCNLCSSELPKLQEIIDQKSLNLKSLCRVEVRRWLWSQKINSGARLEHVLNKLSIPREIKEYIVPVNI